jgi:hypothetical protein
LNYLRIRCKRGNISYTKCHIICIYFLFSHISVVSKKCEVNTLETCMLIHVNGKEQDLQ